MSEWDSSDWREERDKKLLEWFGGDVDAVRCFVDISTISETWDDLIDRDAPMTDETINTAFVCAMVTLPSNRFYVAYQHILQPIMLVSINAWLDSEVLVRRDSSAARMHAFYIRNMLAEIAPAIAFCIGGFAHMRRVSMEIREFLSHESYMEWEHRHVS